jgi:hypothetical protein
MINLIIIDNPEFFLSFSILISRAVRGRTSTQINGKSGVSLNAIIKFDSG